MLYHSMEIHSINKWKIKDSFSITTNIQSTTRDYKLQDSDISHSHKWYKVIQVTYVIQSDKIMVPHTTSDSYFTRWGLEPQMFFWHTSTLRIPPRISPQMKFLHQTTRLGQVCKHMVKVKCITQVHHCGVHKAYQNYY